MKTKKLYQKNVYQTACDSVVSEVVADGKSLNFKGSYGKHPVLFLAFNETVFFPTGGGQPCDLGVISVDKSVDYSVIDVFEREGIVYHVIEHTDAIHPGDHVHLSIDWPRRFSHMQRHCGEHILSGAFDRLFGGVNRGFHMGEDYMTIDISLEKDPAVTQLTWEMAKEAELYANQVIWEDAPVSVHYFETKKEADSMPMRKALTIAEDISIVCVGDPKHPSDCVACCGTHPSTAGQVGIIKIFKLESYKGMTRVYLKAGRQAFDDYVQKNDTITTLSNRYSTEPEKLLDSVEKQERRSQEIRQELAELKRAMMERAQEEIHQFYSDEANWKTAPSVNDAYSADAADSETLRRVSSENNTTLIVRKNFLHFKTDDVQSIGRKAASEIRGLLVLISAKERTAVLFSNGTPDCGRLVRDNVSICQGKGGGNASCARAIFHSDEALENYLDLIEKHLR